MREKPRGRGRPTVGERVKLGLRVTPAMKRQLDRAATESGRSLSQEAEFRLEKSFEREDFISAALTLLYGRRLAGILIAMGQVMDMAARIALNYQGRPSQREDWASDPVAFAEAAQAATEVLRLAAPAGKQAALHRGGGVHSVKALVKALADPTSKSPTAFLDEAQAEQLLDLLGPVAQRMTEAAAKPAERKFLMGLGPYKPGRFGALCSGPLKLRSVSDKLPHACRQQRLAMRRAT